VCHKSQTDLHRMFLSYIDDSGSSGNTQGFQVVGGPIINGDKYTSVEITLWARFGAIIGTLEGFEEFHASHLFYATPPYDKLGLEKCRQLFQCAVDVITNWNIPIIYGAVNKGHLLASDYLSSNAVDVAFRRYVRSLEKWIESGNSGSGIIISDDSGTKSSNRKTITESFHQLRKKPREQLAEFGGTRSIRLLEDIYFSDSKRSTGVQLADVCVYLIGCHLSEKPEQEPYFNKIERLIFEHHSPDIFGV
jgi:hypothetical protein